MACEKEVNEVESKEEEEDIEEEEVIFAAFTTINMEENVVQKRTGKQKGRSQTMHV